MRKWLNIFGVPLPVLAGWISLLVYISIAGLYERKIRNDWSTLNRASYTAFSGMVYKNRNADQTAYSKVATIINEFKRGQRVEAIPIVKVFELLGGKQNVVDDPDNLNRGLFYHDPVTGGYACLEGSNDVVRDVTWTFVKKNRSLGDYQPPARPGLIDALMIPRRLVYLIMAIISGVLIVNILITINPPDQKRHLQLASLILMTGIAAFLGAFIGTIGYRSTWTFIDDDSPGWGLIEITIGLILIGCFLVRYGCLKSPDSGLLCVKCRYLLFGNISGQCPECGEMIPDEQMEHIRKTPASL